MKHIWKCRRTFVGLFAIACLTVLGMKKGIDTSIAIAGVASALSAANAYEKRGKSES